MSLKILRIAFYLIFLIGGCSICQEKNMDASYLIDGVQKIYIVDESKCSGPANKDEAGKVYLIEGKENIEKIRQELKKWTDLTNKGGCLCGGPDKHYYCMSANGQRNYWGLDCDEFINGMEITVGLNALINPKYETFIGIHVGFALVADVPISTDETNLVKMAHDKGYEIFYKGWGKQYYIDNLEDDVSSAGKTVPYYKINILVPTSHSKEEIQRATRAFPFMQNVRCVCDSISRLRIVMDPEIVDSTKLIYSKMPVFPEAALKARLSGSVVVEIIVDEKGSVENVRIMSSTNPIFNDNAIEAVKTWRFTPPTDKKGVNVKIYVTRKIKFNWSESDKVTIP